MNYELIGFTGTVIILCSFLFNNERKIRIFNAFGSIFFVIYGLYIEAWSNVVLNGILIIVHVVKLVKMRHKDGKSEESA